MPVDITPVSCLVLHLPSLTSTFFLYACLVLSQSCQCCPYYMYYGLQLQHKQLVRGWLVVAFTNDCNINNLCINEEKTEAFS